MAIGRRPNLFKFRPVLFSLRRQKTDSLGTLCLQRMDEVADRPEVGADHPQLAAFRKAW